jgi:hypothetical protein
MISVYVATLLQLLLFSQTTYSQTNGNETISFILHLSTAQIAIESKTFGIVETICFTN